LGRYWLSETALSWAAFCDLLDLEPPPFATPKGDGVHFQGDGRTTGRAGFMLREGNKIRLQYCEDATSQARDWHAHVIPSAEERPSFVIDSVLAKGLDNAVVSQDLRGALEAKTGIPLPDQIEVLDRRHWGPGWCIRMSGEISDLFYIVH